MLHQRGADPERASTMRPVPAELAGSMIASLYEPFVLPSEVAAQVQPEYSLSEGTAEVLVAPMRWEPDAFGAVVVVAPAPEARFCERDISLARGISDIAALALGSARRVSELERFHELVETLDAIFWEADPETLEFRFLSSKAAQVLGAKDALPGHWGDHVHEEDRDRVLDAIRTHVAEPVNDLHLEYRTLGHTSETLWLRDLVHVEMDALGRAVLGLVVVSPGASAPAGLRGRRSTDAFHRERGRSVADSRRMKTRSQAVRDLPRSLGSGSAPRSSSQNRHPRGALDLLRRIASNARKLERLLGDLLDLDRLQRGIVAPQRRPTDVRALVRNVVAELELAGDRVVEVDADELVANVDAAKVERIVENLLANAVRHTPSVSRIWVRAAFEGSSVLLVVEDEGDGVPDELKTAIFEPFRQAPGPAQVSPGVGVGLSLVARFAELHGGTAWVQDRPGGGSSFRVLLPED
jgi:PAS domain-containing protein/two-component sensor histidine kinase